MLEVRPQTSPSGKREKRKPGYLREHETVAPDQRQQFPASGFGSDVDGARRRLRFGRLALRSGRTRRTRRARCTVRARTTIQT